MNCKEFCEKYKGYKVRFIKPFYVGAEFEITGYDLTDRHLNDGIVLFNRKSGIKGTYYFEFIDQDSVWLLIEKDEIKNFCKLINTYRSAKKGTD